ncbi:MAG: NusA-like transcription termination signal-binding factor [Candidatus Nanoarchaeia archaeon]|jgi:transcription termination/antitermination protein NusA|nr:NusA-like transcription termination signal-binding factor [Candidatus Nanoarchaeia archaeon]
MKLKYDMQTLQWMKLFEDITKAKIKDCFVHNEKLHFIVHPGNLFKALGENKKNVTRLEDLLKKKVKIIEYSENMLKFIVNIMAPLKVVDIKNEEGIVTITGPDQKTKGLMIGARAQNLRMFEGIVQKYFPELKEIKVV